MRAGGPKSQVRAAITESFGPPALAMLTEGCATRRPIHARRRKSKRICKLATDGRRAIRCDGVSLVKLEAARETPRGPSAREQHNMCRPCVCLHGSPENGLRSRTRVNAISDWPFCWVDPCGLLSGRGSEPQRRIAHATLRPRVCPTPHCPAARWPAHSLAALYSRRRPSFVPIFSE